MKGFFLGGGQISRKFLVDESGPSFEMSFTKLLRRPPAGPGGPLHHRVWTMDGYLLQNSKLLRTLLLRPFLPPQPAHHLARGRERRERERKREREREREGEGGGDGEQRKGGRAREPEVQAEAEETARRQRQGKRGEREGRGREGGEECVREGGGEGEGEGGQEGG
mgnify:CR=1 FL=1